MPATNGEANVWATASTKLPDQFTPNPTYVLPFEGVMFDNADNGPVRSGCVSGDPTHAFQGEGTIAIPTGPSKEGFVKAGIGGPLTHCAIKKLLVIKGEVTSVQNIVINFAYLSKTLI